MKTQNKPKSIKSIYYRRILNSHVQFTTEYVIELDDGTIGLGATPQGETVSLYRKKETCCDPQKTIDKLTKDNMLRKPLTQSDFDAYLNKNMEILGRNNCYALSLAFFEANERSEEKFIQYKTKGVNLFFPKICLNVLNGGWHAYTNPILSDFSEFLLVSRNTKVEEIIKEYNQLQAKISEKLAKCDKIIVNNNFVNRLKVADNLVWLDFLIYILDELGYSSKYDLMIDASAGDLFKDNKYQFLLTSGSAVSRSEMYDYWINLITKYEVKFIEDPFQEQDFENWAKITRAQDKCHIMGDNIYASNPKRIRQGALKKYTHGIVLKPDDAGTVSSTIEAITMARELHQIVMASHRSISTESTLLSKITNRYQIEYIKIGPLKTDYSAVIRLNELIRLSGVGYE